MFYNDHDPPHFHAIYGSHRAVVGIQSVQVLRGTLPRRAWARVREWAALHEHDLLANWGRARAYEPLQAVAPLD